MVDITKTPLRKRIRTLSDNLYSAEHAASPGEVVLSREVYDDMLDILQELTDLAYKDS